MGRESAYLTWQCEKTYGEYMYALVCVCVMINYIASRPWYREHVRSLRWPRRRRQKTAIFCRSDPRQLYGGAYTAEDSRCKLTVVVCEKSSLSSLFSRFCVALKQLATGFAEISQKTTVITDQWRPTFAACPSPSFISWCTKRWSDTRHCGGYLRIEGIGQGLLQRERLLWYGSRMICDCTTTRCSKQHRTQQRIFFHCLSSIRAVFKRSLRSEQKTSCQ